MYRASLTIMIAIPLILLAATVTISSTVSEDAFAREGRYSSDSTSQAAAAVDNSCLNPIFDSNEDIDNAVGVGNCGGTVSQQDESGSASAPITSQTANPAIELQRTTTSPPLTEEPGPVTACQNCFNALTDAQQAAFEAQLTIPVDETITTIEELCEFIDQNPNDASGVLGSLEIILESINIQPSDINSIITCLGDVFNL